MLTICHMLMLHLPISQPQIKQSALQQHFKVPSDEIVVLAYFNVQSKDWLGSNKIDFQRWAVEKFAISNTLTNPVMEPTSSLFPCLKSLRPFSIWSISDFQLSLSHIA